MRGPLWFAAGAGVGVYAMAKARRAAESLTADGIRDRIGALSLGARLVREEVATAQARRETELREQLGLTPHGKHVLTTTHKEISS